MAKKREFVQSQPDLPKMGNEVHPLMGSGYKEGFKAGQKQGGAEVLAAFVKMADDWPRLSDEEFVKKYGANSVRLAIYKLQPAAKALEELLREAHKQGHECENSVIKIDENGRVEGCQYKADLLKKARGISEDK